MTRGLKSLHEMTILHRDLKCANVFCTADSVFKLGDLNVSKVTKKAMARTHTGTPYYTSPEVWKDRPYDLKCDIWSLACVIYEMAALKPPFRANNLKELYNKIQKGIFDRIPSFYSDDLQKMINICMKVNPTMRPTTQEILSHPTILKNTVPSEMYNVEAKRQCNLLKTIAVPKNLKSLKEALPASNYEIETNFEKQVMGKKIESRLNSARSLERIGSVETPKISNNRKYDYISPRP
jgi:NIMA (never in mitosis gene a)-related kinase